MRNERIKELKNVRYENKNCNDYHGGGAYCAAGHGTAAGMAIHLSNARLR
jgi:hypothetical protein